MTEYREQVVEVLRQYNPWWIGKRPQGIPKWQRAAFAEIVAWAKKPPAGRALLLAGARQIGKTTLFLQAIEHLLTEGVRPSNVLYASFDHPLLKLAGIEGVLNIWRELELQEPGPEYLFLDEIHNAEHWQVVVKQQVDFQKNRRIAMTGSATPLVREGQESGVGRWHTVQLATLSFFEFLQIRKIDAPELPRLDSLTNLFAWKPATFARVAADSKVLSVHFHDYLLRGGYPQCALLNTVDDAQRLLRDDIVDKVLKRDMTALFGVRRIVALERLFLFLCMHEGGLVDVGKLGSELSLTRQTVEHFLDLLEAAHLVYRLLPHGYGKEILRARSKVYFTDAAIVPAVLMKGKGLLSDAPALGRAVETTVFKHIFARYYRQNIRFAYWRDRRGREVDVIAEMENRRIPFEVKYRNEQDQGELKGLAEYCRVHQPMRAYVITRSLNDFGPGGLPDLATPIMKLPALLACYWLSRSELESRIH